MDAVLKKGPSSTRVETVVEIVDNHVAIILPMIYLYEAIATPLSGGYDFKRGFYFPVNPKS